MKWISTKEQLPRLEEEVLIFVENSIEKASLEDIPIGGAWTEDTRNSGTRKVFRSSYCCSGDWELAEVTYWMQKPEPPKV